MFCSNCGKKIKEQTSYCEYCGNVVRKNKQRSDNKNSNLFNKILKVIKNILRVFIMFWLVMFSFAYILLDNNWFSICFILCFILLIPHIAGLLYRKLKINRIIKYVVIVILFMVALLNISSTPTTNDLNNDTNIKENNVKTTTKNNKKEEKKIMDIIKSNNFNKLTSTKKINLKEEDGKYIATIPFDSITGYENELECAKYGIIVINSLKEKYKSSVDDKISKYILEFYYKDKLKFKSIYNNDNSNSIDRLTITDNNKKDKIITKADIEKYNKEQEDEYNNYNTGTTETIFDENNINKSITCNNRKVTVKKMKRLTKNENSYVPAGKEYIGVYIIFENKSNRDMNYYESDFNLINDNGQVLQPSYYVLKGMFEHERLNSGTLTPGGKSEGFVMFGNDSIGDKDLSLRVICKNNIIFDDEIGTIELHN